MNIVSEKNFVDFGQLYFICTLWLAHNGSYIDC